MSANLALVEQALDRYLARRKSDPDGLTAARLARLVGVRRGQMSEALQEYRRAQAKGTYALRYTIGCEGYGTAALWFIMSWPGADTPGLEARRMEHAVYIAQDTMDRLVRDYARETEPALQGTVLDQVVEIAADGLVQHVRVAVQGAVKVIRATMTTTTP